MGELINNHMASIPHAVEGIANSEAAAAASDAIASGVEVVGDVVSTGVAVVGDAVSSGASIVADGVKHVLPFDVEMFADIGALLMGVLSRNAHEVPPLDMGELLLCIGMYAHYHLQKKLDEDATHRQEDIFKQTPRVTEREPYERFTYCIAFAEAAYEYTPEAVIERCGKLPSTEAIIDAVYESTTDCPAFFLALDDDHRKIVVAIRGTASLHDAVVDLKMDCEPFLGGYAHQGMAHLCHKLLHRILDKLLELKRDNPSYDLIITGHSLGAGIASLLTLLLCSPEYRSRFPSVRGVCFATPACCTEDLTVSAEGVVDSLVLGYDVIPALSEKSLIWLLRELQKFSKTNQHRKLLSEAWSNQLESVHDALEANPRTRFVIDAWDSEVATSVRNSVGTAASVAKDTIATVTATAQETAIQVVEAAGDAVITLQESGYIPAEPNFLHWGRLALFSWFADLRDDIRQTSTLMTLTLAVSSRFVFRHHRGLRFTVFSVGAAMLGQVSWMRWKRYTTRKLEDDLGSTDRSKSSDPNSSPAATSSSTTTTGINTTTTNKPARPAIAARVSTMDLTPGQGKPEATALGSASKGDGTAPDADGELKDLLTPATLYYLHDWITPEDEVAAGIPPTPNIELGDVAAAVRLAEEGGSEGHVTSTTTTTTTTTAPAPDADPATGGTDGESTTVEERASHHKHVLVRSLPAQFTEITMNVRMIDDHLLSSYRRALENTIWEI
ncbi:hypothetical protein HKX48_001320 [Thoreauomyces humboldtii]|nr:hypothetical protein HKX48_001320 [Thoreauomyces humboldtii]